MTEWMDVLAFKQNKDGKWFPVKLGSAKPSDKGGYDLFLDAIPAPQDGTYRIAIRPRQERSQGQQQGGYEQRRETGYSGGYQDGGSPHENPPF